MSKVEEQLSLVQSNLIAPKDLFNKFGGYSYRSCETILEAVKPLLAQHGLTLVISDEVVNIGDRYYVKATASVVDSEQHAISVSAFAREDLSLKGMNEAQITGSTSSYARKYALNGLFCIDDTKDSDATNTHGKELVEPTNGIEKPKGNPTTKPIDKAPTKPIDTPITDPTSNTLVCSGCGIEITQKVYDYSIDKKGAALCYVCQKK